MLNLEKIEIYYICKGGVGISMDSEKCKLMTVKEFSLEYGIGHNKAYQMVHSEGFPMIKCGRKIIIIRSRIDDWICNQIGKSF